MFHVFWIVLFAASTWGQEAFGAKVVAVGVGFVVIDAGSEQGLKMDDEVCVSVEPPTGPQCVRIAELRARVSGIRFEKMPLVKIGALITSKNLVEKAGQTASPSEIKDLVQSLSKSANSDDANNTDSSFESEEASEASSPQDPPSSSTNMSVFGGFLYTPFLPFSHRIPVYDIEHQISRSDSLWTSDKKVDKSLAGISGGLEFSLRPFWSLLSTFKYRLPVKDNLSVDYDPMDPKVYAKVTTKTFSYGFSVSGLYQAWSYKQFEMGASAGLDFDRSIVSADMITDGGDDQGQVASLTSKILITSLKLGGVFLVPWDVLDLALHTHLLLPIHELKQTSESRHRLRADVSNIQRQNSPDDLERALHHKRAPIGFELGLQVFYDL